MIPNVNNKQNYTCDKEMMKSIEIMKIKPKINFIIVRHHTKKKKEEVYIDNMNL